MFNYSLFKLIGFQADTCTTCGYILLFFQDLMNSSDLIHRIAGALIKGELFERVSCVQPVGAVPVAWLLYDTCSYCTCQSQDHHLTQIITLDS